MRKLLLIFLSTALMLAGCSTRPNGLPKVTPTPKAAATPKTTVSPTPLPTLLPSVTPAPEKKLKVYVTEDEEIREMTETEYLCGVVAGELKGDWPTEALKAQAVVARTFMLYFLQKGEGSMYEGADLSTDTAECQAYDAAGVNDAIRQAVQETQGQILTWQSEPIIAWFHSCSGGKTATATEGLAYEKTNPEYLQAVESDESMAPEDMLSWEAAFSAEEVMQALKMLDISANLDDVAILKRGPSGRTTLLALGGRPVDCVALRMALDPKRFRSTQLTSVSMEDGYLLLEGKGFGHGVGMSQWGAYTMAKKGKTYQEILAHYYQNIQLSTAES